MTKNTRTKLALVLIAVASIFSTHSYAESETVKGAKKDFESFKQEMGVKLEESQKKLDQLQEKAKEKGSHVKNETIEELRSNRDKLKVEYDNLKFEGQTRFQKMKASLSSSIDSLNGKIQKALKD